MTDQPKFQLTADFSPAGDQPQAIAKLVDGLRNGLAHQTLLGVTGSGKTHLADSNLFVFAEEEVLQFVAAGGREEFVSAVGACGIDAAKKLSAIRHNLHGSGLRIRHFLRLASADQPLGWPLSQCCNSCRGKESRLSLADTPFPYRLGPPAVRVLRRGGQWPARIRDHRQSQSGVASSDRASSERLGFTVWGPPEFRLSSVVVGTGAIVVGTLWQDGRYTNAFRTSGRGYPIVHSASS